MKFKPRPKLIPRLPSGDGTASPVSAAGETRQNPPEGRRDIDIYVNCPESV